MHSSGLKMLALAKCVLFHCYVLLNRNNILYHSAESDFLKKFTNHILGIVRSPVNYLNKNFFMFRIIICCLHFVVTCKHSLPAYHKYYQVHLLYKKQFYTWRPFILSISSCHMHLFLSLVSSSYLCLGEKICDWLKLLVHKWYA